jgi:hypothetical protein
MSIYVNKINGKIEAIHVMGEQIEPLLLLLETLWNESRFDHTNEYHSKGIEALDMIMKDWK